MMLGILTALVIVQPPILSQTKAPQTVTVAEGEVRKDKYILGPGDELEVIVSGRVTFSYTATVDLNGYLEINTQGVREDVVYLTKAEFLKVSGLTIQKAEEALQERYKKLIKEPAVRLRLLNARKFLVSISGAVRHPGVYETSPLERLSEVIVKAGGLKGGASLSNIKFGSERINIIPYLRKGDLKANPFMLEGRNIYVPYAEYTVRVKGCVGGHPVLDGQMLLPGVRDTTAYREYVIELLDGETVQDILEIVGGPVTLSDLDAVKIERNCAIIDAGLDTSLKPGDVLEIPCLPRYVYVTGEVKLPGAYPYLPGLTVLDYVSMAGGPTERGKKSSFKVVKRTGEVIKAKPMDLVDRGDRIEVQRVCFKWWEDYLKVMTSLTTLVVTWLTITK